MVHSPIHTAFYKALLYRPCKVVRRNSALDNLLKRVITPQAVQKFIEQYHYENPLSLLSECVGYRCENNRIYTPARRKQFERMIYQQTARIREEELRYVSWGSAGLLSDAIILANILHRYRFKNIHFHGIDDVYKTYQYQNITVSAILYQHPSPSIAHILNRIRQWQIASFFAYLFPECTFQWYWHASTTAYLRDCFPTPHIVVALDITDALYQSYVTQIPYTIARGCLPTTGALSIDL